MKILIIIPCFNEQYRLKVDEFLSFSLVNPNVYFLFVNDGSTDKTLNMLKSLCSKHASLNYLSFEKNQGKSEAIRHGVLSIRTDIDKYLYVGYFDADLSVPLREIPSLLEVIKKRPEIKFVLGMRLARLGANINRNLIRHYLGRIFATIVSNILREPVYDTQCGAKLIHSSLAIKLFENPFISKWLFDVELLSRYKKYYPKTIDLVVEYPISEWNEVYGSKLKAKYYLLAPLELLKIWLKYRKFLN